MCPHRPHHVVQPTSNGWYASRRSAFEPHEGHPAMPGGGVMSFPTRSIRIRLMRPRSLGSPGSAILPPARRTTIFFVVRTSLMRSKPPPSVRTTRVNFSTRVTSRRACSGFRIRFLLRLTAGGGTYTQMCTSLPLTFNHVHVRYACTCPHCSIHTVFAPSPAVRCRGKAPSRPSNRLGMSVGPLSSFNVCSGSSALCCRVFAHVSFNVSPCAPNARAALTFPVVVPCASLPARWLCPRKGRPAPSRPALAGRAGVPWSMSNIVAFRRLPVGFRFGKVLRSPSLC